mgnify:CR=1 FL=1
MTKLFIGPMSKNIVDATISYSEEHSYKLALIIGQLPYFLNMLETKAKTLFLKETTVDQDSHLIDMGLDYTL